MKKQKISNNTINEYVAIDNTKIQKNDLFLDSLYENNKKEESFPINLFNSWKNLFKHDYELDDIIDIIGDVAKEDFFDNTYEERYGNRAMNVRRMTFYFTFPNLISKSQINEILHLNYVVDLKLKYVNNSTMQLDIFVISSNKSRKLYQLALNDREKTKDSVRLFLDPNSSLTKGINGIFLNSLNNHFKIDDSTLVHPLEDHIFIGETKIYKGKINVVGPLNIFQFRKLCEDPNFHDFSFSPSEVYDQIVFNFNFFENLESNN